MPDAADVPVQAGRPVGRPPKPKRPATVRDMVLSLLVVGAAIGVFLLLLPRSQHQKVTPVEYLPTARALAHDTSLPVYVPDPPPPGWVANYVRVGPGPAALHVGFVLSAKRFARLDETAKPDSGFYDDANVDPSTSPVDPAGISLPAGFELHRSGSHAALLRHLPGGGVLMISDGGTSSGATLPELADLARSLKLQPGGAARS
jgi:hypothetical protein